jgi:ribose transport system ATP-binding protein
MPSVELVVEGATKSFAGIRVVDAVDLTIRSGEVIALLGENGAGKSTLMKVIAGVHAADAGAIRIAGEPVDIVDVRAARAHGIAMVHQELNLTENQTVAQNIALGRVPTRGPAALGLVDGRRVEREARAALDAVGSRVRPGDIVGDLSIAQRQQVEIAKALAQADVSVLLLDEPTSSLPEEQAEELLVLLRRLRDQGIAVVITTHRMEEAFGVADRIVVLRDGAKVGEFDARAPEATKDRIIETMVGRTLTALFPDHRTPGDEVVLSVEGLSGGIVDDVSFDVRRGEIFGLGGLVGAGRTEAVRLLFGADRRSRGVTRLHGSAVRIRSPRDAVRLGIGLVPEDRKAQGLVQLQDVAANVALPNLRSWQRFGLIRMRRLGDAVADAIRAFGIKTRGPNQIVSRLSGGNQQKVVLAKWLAQPLTLLILDEPTRGVDVGARADIYRQIDDIAARGVGVLLVSSDMEELIGLSDRIGVMAEGRYMGTLAAADVTQEAILRLASNVESLDVTSPDLGGTHDDSTSPPAVA